MKFLTIAAALATVAVADVGAPGAAGGPVSQIGDGQVQVGTQTVGQQTTAPTSSAPITPPVSCTSGPATVVPPPIGTGTTGPGVGPTTPPPVIAGAGRVAGGAVAAVAVAVALL